jgi:hypothetical protein
LNKVDSPFIESPLVVPRFPLPDHRINWHFVFLYKNASGKDSPIRGQSQLPPPFDSFFSRTNRRV